MVTIPRWSYPTWSYKQGHGVVVRQGFTVDMFFQWCSTEVKGVGGGGMTKHKKALTFVGQ